jgi:hypothetical protein
MQVSIVYGCIICEKSETIQNLQNYCQPKSNLIIVQNLLFIASEISLSLEFAWKYIKFDNNLVM